MARSTSMTSSADRLHAVVFDFDGLLMDTESTMVDSWRDEWAHHGLELDLTDGFWPGHGGDVTEHRYNQLAARVGPSFDRAASHARRMERRDRRHESLGLCPGIRDWLRDVRALGLRPAVASSSPATWLRSHLERVAAYDLFEVIAAGNEVGAHKPDPAVYLLALERLGIPAENAVAVEDTPHGVAAAQAAGMATVAIPNPFVAADDLAAADVVLSSAAELPLTEVLERLRP